MKQRPVDSDYEISRKRRYTRSLSVDWDRVIASQQGAGVRKLSRKTDSYSEEDLYHPGFITFERSSHEFITGSVYAGKWNSLGMAGLGIFKFVHGVEFEGNLYDGMFHGEGTLTYPMGQKLEGEWVKGKMVSFKFSFTDGLGYDAPWKYCIMPDRRFYTSILEGLRPAGRSLATNKDPPRKIPEGCYDTGDGFYNPKTKCVTSAIKPGKILRVPTAAEEKWIMENCRKAWDEPVGYRPDLFEHWVTGRSTDSVFADSEGESGNSQTESTSSSSDAAAERIDTLTSLDENRSLEDNWWDKLSEMSVK